MGLREAIFSSVVILGLVAVAGADQKPSKSHAGKAGKAGKAEKDPPAADPKAEQPDPAAAANSGTDPAAAPDGDPADQPPLHVVGPKHVDLGNNVAIDLPEGMWLFERAVAVELMRKNGNSTEGLLGIVIKPGAEWVAHIEYNDSGYIDDSDANELDADELLESYREGTAEQNKQRKQLGNSELFIDRWSEVPRYERAAHHLVWGIAGHSIEGKVINFFTRILGRNGYLSVTLIDNPETIEASKQEALPVLQATRFNAGSTYADHVTSDRSSGMGLRGLVLGGAGVAVAAKLGIFAKVLAVLLKLALVLKKGLILIALGIGGAFRWLFRRKPKVAPGDPIAGGGDFGAPPSYGAPPSDPSGSSGMPPSGGPPGGPGDGSGL